jgi:hypothetical protein
MRQWEISIIIGNEKWITKILNELNWPKIGPKVLFGINGVKFLHLLP